MGDVDRFGFCRVVVGPPVEPGACNGADALGFMVEVLGLGTLELGLGTGVCCTGAAALGFGVAGVAADGPADGACALIAPAANIEPATAATNNPCFCREYIEYLLAILDRGRREDATAERRSRLGTAGLRFDPSARVPLQRAR